MHPGCPQNGQPWHEAPRPANAATAAIQRRSAAFQEKILFSSPLFIYGMTPTYPPAECGLPFALSVTFIISPVRQSLILGPQVPVPRHTISVISPIS